MTWGPTAGHLQDSPHPHPPPTGVSSPPAPNGQVYRNVCVRRGGGTRWTPTENKTAKHGRIRRNWKQQQANQPRPYGVPPPRLQVPLISGTPQPQRLSTTTQHGLGLAQLHQLCSFDGPWHAMRMRQSQSTLLCGPCASLNGWTGRAMVAAPGQRCSLRVCLRAVHSGTRCGGTTLRIQRNSSVSVLTTRPRFIISQFQPRYVHGTLPAALLQSLWPSAARWHGPAMGVCGGFGAPSRALWGR